MKSYPINNKLFFYGDADSPLLAPRGVWLQAGKLIISDTAQNRVFIWNKIPKSSQEKPDIVLGQNETHNVQRNAGGAVNAQSMHYPSGIWTDGKRLIVADAWNHRVLVWLEFPNSNGQAADVVIGQQNFDSNQPNVKGIAAPPTANTLYWPYGVFSDGKQLWIADTGNRRILYYESIPEANFQAADKVVGQESFEEKDYESKNAVWPYSINISRNGAMAVSDTQYYRVLVWDKWQDSFEKTADHVLGQDTLESNGVNRNMHPGPNTLNWNYQSVWGQHGLWIADTGNSRVVFYPLEKNKLAVECEHFLGTTSIEAVGEFDQSLEKNFERLYWPFGVCESDSILAVADTGNHRLILYTLKEK